MDQIFISSSDYLCKENYEQGVVHNYNHMYQTIYSIDYLLPLFKRGKFWHFRICRPEFKEHLAVPSNCILKSSLKVANGTAQLYEQKSLMHEF